jgi:hypothetical protein
MQTIKRLAMIRIPPQHGIESCFQGNPGWSREYFVTIVEICPVIGHAAHGQVRRPLERIDIQTKRHLLSLYAARKGHTAPVPTPRTSALV